MIVLQCESRDRGVRAKLCFWADERAASYTRQRSKRAVLTTERTVEQGPIANRRGIARHLKIHRGQARTESGESTESERRWKLRRRTIQREALSWAIRRKSGKSCWCTRAR